MGRFGSRNGSHGSKDFNTLRNTSFGPSTLNVHDFLQKNGAIQSQRQDGGGFKPKKEGSTQPQVQCQICDKLGHLANKCFQLCDLLQCM